MKFARTVVRLVLVALVAAIFIQVAELYAASMRPPRFAQSNPYLRALRHQRPAAPQANRLPSFAGEVILVALIAVGGRKLLHLRLTD